MVLTFDDFPLAVQVWLHDTWRWIQAGRIHLLFVPQKWGAPKAKKTSCWFNSIHFQLVLLTSENTPFKTPRCLARCGTGGPVSETNLISSVYNQHTTQLNRYVMQVDHLHLNQKSKVCLKNTLLDHHLRRKTTQLDFGIQITMIRDSNPGWDRLHWRFLLRRNVRFCFCSLLLN